MEYDKLVRDKIPEILVEKGANFEQHTASDEEYKERLLEKLDEEIAEFKEEYSAEELADVIEVIEALKRLPEYQTVDLLQKKKFEERGGFDKRIIIKGKK